MGTPDAWFVIRRTARFSPAGAGNTMSSPTWLTPQSVYPRWRGEHPRRDDMTVNNDGLSPLARGTPREYLSQSNSFRFIPAGAGNTVAHFKLLTTGTVYPRWRGEHTQPRKIDDLIGGLSPLARGTPQHRALFPPIDRFIPAGAGNTQS